MTQVVIPKDLLDEMVEYCREGIPNEACGIRRTSGPRKT